MSKAVKALPPHRASEAARALAPTSSLTVEQMERRKLAIGASEAPIIMRGEWLQLWLEKTGRAEPPNFDDVLPMQMGIATEALNRRWYEQRTGFAVVFDKTVTHLHGDPARYWMVCHLDGLVTIEGKVLPWEAKHTNAFDPVDKIITTYYAQFQHQMEVCGADQARVSVFYGNLKWAEHIVPRDADYVVQLVTRELEFMDLLQRDISPAGQQGATPAPSIVKPRVIDMTTGNRAGMWRDEAETWLKHRAAVAASDAAESSLKTMVPTDAGLAYGNGVAAAKNKAGAISLRVPTKGDLKRIAGGDENGNE